MFSFKLCGFGYRYDNLCGLWLKIDTDHADPRIQSHLKPVFTKMRNKGDCCCGWQWKKIDRGI